MSYREALKEYNIALRYHPDDIDLKTHRDYAYDKAITKVIVAPMHSFTGYQYTSSYQLSNFQNEIVRILAKNMHNDFIRFYTEWDANTKKIIPDQVLELSFTRVTVGQPFDERDTKELSKQVVVKEVVYKKPDTVIKQYGTVYAKVVSVKRTLISQGDLYITVRDTKGGVIWDDKFTGENRWTTVFSNYTGDERALSDADRDLCKKGEGETPNENKIMADLMGKIQNDLCARLNNYYTKAF